MPEKKRKANSFATLAKFVIVVMMMIIRLVFELMFTHPGNKEHAFLLATIVCSTTEMLAKDIHSYSFE